MSAFAKGSLKWRGPGSEKCNESDSLLQGLQDKNSKLAIDLQNEKVINAQLLSKVVKLSQCVQSSAAESNRYRQCISRINAHVKDFVPALLKCSDLVNKMVEEIECVSSPSPGSLLNRSGAITLPTADGGIEDINSRSPESAPNQRTGIAKPIVQGHTIFKPSVSLQRFQPVVLPRCNPTPVRGLRVSDLLVAAERSLNEGLSDIVEEEDEEEHDSIIPLYPVEGAADEETLSDGADAVVVAVTTESTDEVVAEAVAGPSGGMLQTETARAEEISESSDDEAIELNLIESRRQLSNCARRKDLKEGTSQDYDDLGHFTPGGTWKRKRRRKQKREALSPGSPGATVNNGITAARRSVNGLLNSLDRTSVAGEDSPRRLETGSPERSKTGSESGIKTSARRPGSRSPFPRVNIIRLQPEEHPGCSSENAGFHSADAEIIGNGGSPNRNEVIVDDIPRVRHGMITTRKRSAKAVSVASTSSDDDESLAQAGTSRHPAKKIRKRSSWTALMRKRSRSLSKSPEPPDEEILHVGPEFSPRPMTPDVETSPIKLPGELPTVLLQRCSDSFIEENQPKDPTAMTSGGDTLRAPVVDRVHRNSGGVSNDEPDDRQSGAVNRSRPKRGGRPKPRSKPKKTSNGKSEDSRKSSGSRSELEASRRKTSHSSASESHSNSLNSNFELEADSTTGLTGSGRPRRGTARVNLKEKPLNVKMRR